MHAHMFVWTLSQYVSMYTLDMTIWWHVSLSNCVCELGQIILKWSQLLNTNDVASK